MRTPHSSGEQCLHYVRLWLIAGTASIGLGGGRPSSRPDPLPSNLGLSRGTICQSRSTNHPLFFQRTLLPRGNAVNLTVNRVSAIEFYEHFINGLRQNSLFQNHRKLLWNN